MIKYFVEIPEVHKALIEIESNDILDRDTILRIAQDKFESDGSNVLEYSHTLEPDEWTVRDDNGTFV